MDIEKDEWLESALREIRGERIPRLIREVWACLPEGDKAALMTLVRFQVAPDYVMQDSMAVCAWQCGLALDGEGFYVVRIRSQIDNDANLSDVFVRYLIAHELAHALLRHPRMGEVFRDTSIYTDNADDPGKNVRDVVNIIFEDSANLQVRYWGFIDELEAQHEFDPNRSPRWYGCLARTQKELDRNAEKAKAEIYEMWRQNQI